MTAPSAVPANQNQPGRLDDEVDLWWGSYAGRAMMASFAVCILLTVCIYVGARLLKLERGWLQLTFTALAGLVWLVQLFRWGRRFFTWNYRLTSRFLYVDRGWEPLIANRYPLQTIASVAVRRRGLAKWLGIGDIVILFDDPEHVPVILQALVNPRSVAETIREAVKKPKESLPS